MQPLPYGGHGLTAYRGSAAADSVACGLFDGTEVSARMGGTHPALVITKHHIQHPVQAVFHYPVRARQRALL